MDVFFIQQTQQQWQIVFVVAAVVYLFGVIFYIFLASAELQPWGVDVPSDTTINMVDTEENPKGSKNIVKSDRNIPETETLMQNSKM